MDSTLQFKAHCYGANMESLCVEEEVVKMVVEMLLGICNDLFTHLDEPLVNLFTTGNSFPRCTFAISVFQVTQFGLHLQTKGLSSALIIGVLNWFAQFGSHIFVCRKFAYSFASGNEQHHLSSAVVDTLKSTLTNLLTTLEESLCAFESQVLGVQKLDTHWNQENNQLRYNPKLTLIGLYQQCLKLAPLFRSLAGVVGSVVTVMASVSAQSTEESQSTNAISTIVEKLLVRGIMQEISEGINLGRLVDISSLQSGGKASTTQGIVSHSTLTGRVDLPNKDLFGGKNADLYEEPTANTTPVIGSPERTPERPAQAVAVDLSLKFQLADHAQSELYLFSKLLLSAMSEQYLTNLTTAVWHQQIAKGSSTQQAELGSSSSAAVWHSGPADGSGLARDSAAGADSRAVKQAITAMDVRLMKQSSRSAARQTHRNHLALLRRIESLVGSGSSYEVPAFLAAITAEAVVSSTDIQILQKSRIQRQNQSYNLSRLKVLVQSSAEECRSAIIPEYHQTAPAITSTTTRNNSTSIAATTTSNHTSSGYLSDPVMSYLRTGRSVKIVGVRTPKVVPSYRVHRPEKSNEASQLAEAALSEASRERAQAERLKLVQSSQTLQSYEAGAITSNAHYLSELTEAAISSVKTSSTSALPPPSQHEIGKEENDDVVSAGVSSVPLSRLLCYTPSAMAVEVSLMSSLREQLQHARVDCAAYVRKAHYLSDNLRFVRDVFFLGQPDLYSPIRELCLALTDWSTYSEASVSKRGYTKQASDLAFMGESIASAISEKMPKSGVRHVSVQVQADSHLRATVTRPVGSSPQPVAPVPDVTSSKGMVDLLREAVSSMRPPVAGAATSEAHIRSTERRRGPVDEVTLLTVVSTLNVNLLHQWPLTYFVDSAQLRSLIASLRFLMLITASRWAAEYWWMDVISNDSLNTAASGNPKADLRTGRSFTTGRTLSAQDLHLGDVLQAKRNTRAGLGIWLHCVTALNNIFMAHIHRTLWPAFEGALSSHEDSLLQMRRDLHEVLADAAASLQLLRDCILEVVVLGFAAAQALRDAIICEQAELSVVVEHNNGIRAAQLKKAPRSKPTEKEVSVKSKDAPKPWKTYANAPLARTSSAHSMVSDTDTVISGLSGVGLQDEDSPFASYRTSAAVLIAFRASEDAFAALKVAVERLKAEVSAAVRGRLAMGRVDREGKALEELHMALS